MKDTEIQSVMTKKSHPELMNMFSKELKRKIVEIQVYEREGYVLFFSSSFLGFKTRVRMTVEQTQSIMEAKLEENRKELISIAKSL